MSKTEIVEERFFPVHPENDLTAPPEAVALRDKWNSWVRRPATRGPDGEITKFRMVSFGRSMKSGVKGFYVIKGIHNS